MYVLCLLQAHLMAVILGTVTNKVLRLEDKLFIIELFIKLTGMTL